MNAKQVIAQAEAQGWWINSNPRACEGYRWLVEHFEKGEWFFHYKAEAVAFLRKKLKAKS